MQTKIYSYEDDNGHIVEAIKKGNEIEVYIDGEWVSRYDAADEYDNAEDFFADA